MDSLLSIDLPAKCNKADIKTLALNIIENSIEDNRVLKTAEGLAVLEKLVKAVREEPRFINAVVDVLELNNRSMTTNNGTLLECVEAGVKYDYSYDDEWKILDEQVKAATEARKSRESILKSVRSGKESIDQDTGEVVIGANKKSKSTYRLTLSK